MDKHIKYMKLAIQTAEKARGKCSPNPFVGAVIVRDDHVISTGWTQSYGSDHAEVQALKKAGTASKGCDMYVTLEPCSHYGKTPPCANAIIEAGIKRLFLGIIDPNPLVTGKGITMLRQAGIEVTVGYLEDSIQRQLEYYLCHIEKQRPFVTLKTALSLDGKYAAMDGSSRWISNEAARKYTHRLRSENDVILTGIKAVLIDNPMLNVRLSGKHKQPLRVIIDPLLEIPQDSQIAQTMLELPTLILCDVTQLGTAKHKQLTKLGAQIQGLKTIGGLFDLHEVMQHLHTLNLYSVLLESGSGLAESLLKARLIDKCLFFYGAKIVGGDKSSFGNLGRCNIKDAIEMKHISVKRFGNNVLVSGYPVY